MPSPARATTESSLAAAVTGSGTSLVVTYLANERLGIAGDRGNLLDWTRLFWDLDHTWALSTSQIFALWDAADPHSWDTNGGGGANDVQERFEVAADPAHVNVQAQWSAAAAANGVY